MKGNILLNGFLDLEMSAVDKPKRFNPLSCRINTFAVILKLWKLLNELEIQRSTTAKR